MLRKSLQFPSVFYIKRREGVSLAGKALQGRIFLKQWKFSQWGSICLAGNHFSERKDIP